MQIGTNYNQIALNTIGPSGDNEAVERVPDNEPNEIAVQRRVGMQKNASGNNSLFHEWKGQRINILA